MSIPNCTIDDLPQINDLYEAARRLQKQRKMVIWPSFPESLLIEEISGNRQWKIYNAIEILCNWAITFNDKEIWEDKDQDNAIYIHRICTNPNYRGNRYIDQIMNWAIPYAKSLGRKYVRLDTLGNNRKLIEHYTSSGFDFIGIFYLTNTSTVPKHYQDGPNCCLFEIDMEKINS